MPIKKSYMFIIIGEINSIETKEEVDNFYMKS